MKKLGFGCMRLPLTDPKDQTTINAALFEQMIDRFLARGYTYFDTAYPYHGKESESFVKRCLVDRHPRDSFQLATKLFLFGAESREHAYALFEQQLEKCGVEYFDYYLLHNLNEKNYQKALDFDCFTMLQEKKAEGKIRKAGFSFHGSAELLERILTEHPEAEFVQLQINYLDWEDSRVQSRLCYETARRHGKDVIIMEPCKGGDLAVVPEQAQQLMDAVHPGSTAASWAFRYVGALEGVIMVLSGMSDMAQLEENCTIFDAVAPLTSQEQEVIRQTVAIIDAVTPVKCTGCRYCEEGCPMSIPIPDCFSLYNRFARTQFARIKNSYNMTTQGKGKASDCIACGACIDKCPQNLPIPQLLKDAAAALEN